MRHDLSRTIVRLMWAMMALCWPLIVYGQNQCLSQDEIKKMVEQVGSSQVHQLDKKLEETLVKAKAKHQKGVAQTIAGGREDDLRDDLKARREANTLEICQILKTSGWPTADLVGKDGAEAAFFLLKNSSSFPLQAQLLPVVVAAVKRGDIPKSDFAGYVDLLRLKAGLKQIFGTQATISDGFLVLYPIEGAAQVDARRKQYDLSPLAVYINVLEGTYRLPLIQSTGALSNSFSDSAKKEIAKSTAANLFEGEEVSEDEIVRVDTNVVSLNVSVYSNQLRTGVSTLEQKDFAVSEDGREEAISFFASTDVPFDLVLLIDMSGSTASKRNLIRKSTQRFIDAARPKDRLAIVTFASTATVVSPLTDDREKLRAAASAINGDGGSCVWDALKFTLDEVIGQKSLERRRAIVFMTDGVDNNLGAFRAGSAISFGDLLEAVRHNDTLIIPIYLDTEGESAGGRRMYENARRTLQRLADESGGLYYKAKKIEDLEGVYEQVIADLGKIYSLGYKPTNGKRNGTWRAVTVQILNHPELNARTRPGYYAN